ncbi:MAG: hypothetical protein ACOC0Z_06655, partial [Halohasta sp.]
LFLMPVLLVLVVQFARIVLPELLAEEPHVPLGGAPVAAIRVAGETGSTSPTETGAGASTTEVSESGTETTESGTETAESGTETTETGTEPTGATAEEDTPPSEGSTE